MNALQTYITIPEIELTFRTELKPSQKETIQSSIDSANILRKYYPEGKIELQEIFTVLLLNRGNKVIGIYEHSRGGLSGTVVDIKLLLATALKSLSSGMILCHNHPSGNKQPSQQDKTLTRKLKEACQMLEISVLDHIILTEEDYFSFADEGLL